MGMRVTHTPHFTPILDPFVALPGAPTPAQSPATLFKPTLTCNSSPPRSSRGGKYKGEENLAKPRVTAAVQHGSQCGTRLWRKCEYHLAQWSSLIILQVQVCNLTLMVLLNVVIKYGVVWI